MNLSLFLFRFFFIWVLLNDISLEDFYDGILYGLYASVHDNWADLFTNVIYSFDGSPSDPLVVILGHHEDQSWN